MTEVEMKAVALCDVSLKSSVANSTGHLGCRVLQSAADGARIDRHNDGLLVSAAAEEWLLVNQFDPLNSQYQAVCQGNQITVQWLGGRIAGFRADKLAVINQVDLAVALACFLECGYEHLDALTLALAWLTQQSQGAGAAWPENRTWFPKTYFSDDHQLPENGVFSSISKDQFTLYPVVDTVEWLDLVLKQGVTTAQLRIKDPNDPDLKTKIQQAIALGQKHDAQIFINDYWQLAIELGAYGVHLGQEDIEVANLTAIQQAGLRLGISTHGYFEIMRAFNLKPSYIALGHIFPTVTKDMPSQPQGLTRLGQYVALIDGAYPTVAIGGINGERLPRVKATGVDSVALVTAITRAEDPKAATRGLLDAMTGGENDATVCE